MMKGLKTTKMVRYRGSVSSQTGYLYVPEGYDEAKKVNASVSPQKTRPMAGDNRQLAVGSF